ncbi:MAG: hypothetical protein HQL95_08120 [Magnetococcales bacterium]|nr:hypothetical protein [Magnetococcales bacterium]
MSNIFLGHFSKIVGMYLETDRDESKPKTTQPERFPMINTTHPDDMTAEARLDEAAAILAAGIKRLKEKQKTEKIPLDKSANQCPYGRKKTTRGGMV